MNSWILHITYKPPRLQVAVDIFHSLWCQVFHLGLKLDVLRFAHTWGRIHNKCNGVVLSSRFKAILQARALAHGKNRPDGVASATPCVTSIHHCYHRHPLIIILPPALRWFGERKWSNQIPVDLFGLLQGSLCDLGVVLVLALWGATVVMAPRPRVAGGGSSRRSSPSLLWRNALTKLWSPPLSHTFYFGWNNNHHYAWVIV